MSELYSEEVEFEELRSEKQRCGNCADEPDMKCTGRALYSEELEQWLVEFACTECESVEPVWTPRLEAKIRALLAAK